MAKGKKQTKVEAGYKVAKPFRDKVNFDLEYQVGEDVSHFDEERIKSLVERGLVTGSPPEADTETADDSTEDDNTGDTEQ